MKNIPFNKVDIKAYLDRCIIHWREKKMECLPKASYYIDAFQCVRKTLFGELLPVVDNERMDETPKIHYVTPHSDNIQELIQQEVNWCEKHAGESGESADFEKGFLSGLHQAMYLIDVFQEATKGKT